MRAKMTKKQLDEARTFAAKLPRTMRLPIIQTSTLSGGGGTNASGARAICISSSDLPFHIFIPKLFILGHCSPVSLFL